MANRIVLAAGGLKVSKPGYNVLTTGQENLIFDTSYPGFGVMQTGLISIAGDSMSTVWFNAGHTSIGYLPMAAWSWWTSGSVIYQGGYYTKHFIDAQLDGAGDPTGIEYYTLLEGDGIIGRCYNNKLELTCCNTSSITCRYVIFHQKAFS